ncbi:hypothetical protein BASA50_003467 [Batrachochytrium salamandrivorans]|uniref:Protein kinase domain-containing protein n=1 Tax=Batrachochytrium salamandrivorans TaxID=1357716 RepID=A0ABQ8FIU6_9FUNG|nr:hypothetical protein BASA50_003467 [Batrachochytrium salamandrivorans]
MPTATITTRIPVIHFACSPQSDEMSLPAYLGKSEENPTVETRKLTSTMHYHASETQYFKSEYLFETELVLSEEASVAQCMSSRPPNLLLSYELLLQMYLSRPGHENPYVPTTFDYITLKNKFVLVMEYIGGSWVTLSKYVEGKERPDIVEARNIIREIVNGMIYLKQYGILHRDIHVDTHPVSVDHCILCDQQLLSTSIAHLVVECEQVTGHRIQSGLVPAIQKSRLRLLGRALDPGVENVYTWLRGGVLNGEADLDQRWLDGTVEHGSMGTRHDNRMLGNNG